MCALLSRSRCAVLLAVAGLLAALAGTVATAPAAQAACGTLTIGSRGACVLSVQQRLTALHYDLGTPDGRFGPQTQAAVIAFEKVNGLYRDGVVGSKVRYKLWHSPVIPRPRYATSGSALEVNLSKQVLYRISAGRIAKIFHVSTGRPSLPTPVSYGRPLHILGKAVYGSTGTFNDSEHWVQYYYTGYGGYKYAIHEYYSVPTYPASHGCIRVPNGGAYRLWAKTYVGERVYTYY